MKFILRYKQPYWQSTGISKCFSEWHYMSSNGKVPYSMSYYSRNFNWAIYSSHSKIAASSSISWENKR